MALFPRINDVTTCADNPPQFFVPGRSRARAQLSSEAYAAHQGYYAGLKPLIVRDLAPAKILAVVERLARQAWRDVVVDPDALRVQAVAVTKLWRFRDDVVIELRAVDGNACEIHMRSKSRLGRSDLGANAERIRSFLARVRQALMV